MSQQFRIDLDTLVAELEVEEDGDGVSYEFKLAPDRVHVAVTRSDGVEERSWACTLPELAQEVAGAEVPRHPAVVWVARGLKGIPLDLKSRGESLKARKPKK